MYHVTAEHIEGGTWSALGCSPEEAQASMDRHLKAFPKSYKSVRSPAPCEVAECGFGLVWKITSDAEYCDLGATSLPSPEDVERDLGSACSIEEARRRVEWGKQLRAEMMRPKKKGT